MTETAPSKPAAERQFGLQRIYLKDVSFESPAAPAVFQQPWKPEVDVQIETQVAGLAEGVHEVVLRVTVTAKLDGKPAYLAEVKQAGVFQINGFSEAEVGPLLGAYCPNALYPFAREVIASLTGKGGFPALQLGIVNFEGLYAQHVEEQRRRASTTTKH